MIPLRLRTAILLAAGGLAAGQLVGRPMDPPGTPMSMTIRDGALTIPILAPEGVRTVGELLDHAAVARDGSIVVPSEETALRTGMEIRILRQRTITIRDGTAPPTTFTTIATDVGRAVADAGVTLGPLDRLNPDATSPIRDRMTIEVIRVAVEERRERVAIPFRTRIVEDATLPFGEERVIVPGRTGLSEEFVRIRYENGKPIGRTVMGRSILEEPVDEQRLRGTAIAVGRTIEGQASWYRFRGGDFAASTMFRKGTWLRVTNPRNGAQVIVRVADFGPTAGGRILDLDAAAFRKLAPLSLGLIPVRVEEIRTDGRGDDRR